ncbi:MAG: complex I NDUFA9 subunit family protein [Betaproteobacteria bacterium]|nr:MAG: complex I NDUFA9 subunit family protein [Betaproteobacteria bacterium]
MNILILGGSGFVGRAICNKLVADGHSVTVPTRKRDNARALFPLPTLTVEEADITDVATLARLAKGKDAVINLVGILNEKKRGDFERAHVTLTERALEACKLAKVGRYLHMSALGASTNAPSDYQKTKARAEAAVMASGLNATIFAPSVIFGNEDSFLNKFAAMIKLMPPLVPMALPGASTQFQPVWVDDVARAFVGALQKPDTSGQRYELAGPKRYSLKALVAYVMATTEDRHLIIGLPGFASAALAGVLQFVPTQPLTPDNVKSMQVDNVSDAAWPSFAGARTALESVVPRYLGRAAVTDTFASARERAGHS